MIYVTILKIEPMNRDNKFLSKDDRIVITDGTNTLVVTREILDIKVENKEISINGQLSAKCLGKQKDSYNRITAYKLCDSANNQLTVTADALKGAMANYKICCDNLKLAYDGRIFDKAGVIEKHNKKVVKEVNDIVEVSIQNEDIIPINNKNPRGVKDNCILLAKATDDKAKDIGIIFSDIQLYKLITGKGINIFSLYLGEHNVTIKSIDVSTPSLHFRSINYSHCTLSINSIKARNIESTKLITLDAYENNEITISANLFDISYGMFCIADNTKVKLYITNNIIGENAAFSGIKDLTDSGKLEVYTKYKSRAFNTFINKGITIKLIDTENNDKLEKLYKTQEREKVLNVNMLSHKVEQYVQLVSTLEKTKSESVSTVNGIDIELTDDIIKAHKLNEILRSGSEPSIEIVEPFNRIIKLLIDIVPLCTKPITDKFNNIAKFDTNYKSEYVLLKKHLNVRIGLLGIGYTGIQGVDKYLIITNGNKLIHMGLIDSIELHTNGMFKDTKKIENAYSFFDFVQGHINLEIIQSVSCNNIDRDLKIKICTLIHNLITANSVYIRGCNLLIVPTGTGYKFFRYALTNRCKVSSYGDIDGDTSKILGEQLYTYRYKGVQIIEDESESTIFENIRNGFNNLYNESVTEYIDNNVSMDSGISDNATIKEQKQSIIFSIAQKFKDKLLSNINMITRSIFLKQLSIDEMHEILNNPLFTEISEKDYNKLKRHGSISTKTDTFRVTTSEVSTKSKCIGQYMYEGNEAIIVSDLVANTNRYYVGVLRLDYFLVVLRGIVERPRSIDINTVYTQFEPSNYRLIDVEVDLNALNVKTVEEDSQITRSDNAILFSSANWIVNSKSSDKNSMVLRQITIVIENATGLLYAVQSSSFRTKSRKNACSILIANQVIMRLADTKSAMLLYKTICQDEHRETTSKLVKCLTYCNEKYTHVLPTLQRNNASKQCDYISMLGDDLYSFMKEYIAYFNGTLQVENE